MIRRTLGRFLIRAGAKIVPEQPRPVSISQPVRIPVQVTPPPVRPKRKYTVNNNPARSAVRRAIKRQVRSMQVDEMMIITQEEWTRAYSPKTMAVRVLQVRGHKIRCFTEPGKMYIIRVK